MDDWIDASTDKAHWQGEYTEKIHNKTSFDTNIIHKQ